MPRFPPEHRSVENLLGTVEARLKDLRIHIPPNLSYAIQDLVEVARMQQEEIQRLSSLMKDDGR